MSRLHLEICKPLNESNLFEIEIKAFIVLCFLLRCLSLYSNAVKPLQLLQIHSQQHFHLKPIVLLSKPNKGIDLSK